MSQITLDNSIIDAGTNPSAANAGAGVATNAGANADAPVPGMIRNILQTVQEREVIRTCPDLIVYLNGTAYLLNPYITSQNNGYTYVAFNDYLQNFTAGYDVDNLIPSGNFTLLVPNHKKYLFQSPGGNNLIETMMEVQVFVKGYYASPNGNTIYYRVFKGMTSHIAHTDNGAALEISVQILGVLQFMEFMYTDLAPSLITNSDRTVPVLSTRDADLNPYQMIASLFQRGISLEGLQLNTLQEGMNVKNSQWNDAVVAGYVNKWTPILLNIAKEVHVTGFSPKSIPQNKDTYSTPTPDTVGKMGPEFLAGAVARAAVVSRIDALNEPDYFVDVIKGYLPEMSIGHIEMVNGRVVPLLERVRMALGYIGYEGFQDIDGTVIFKPPLYNLDVTKVNDPKDPSSLTSGINITDQNNPFIVRLSEVISESESEDQQGIKATRLSIQPDLSASNKFINMPSMLQPVSSHIDIPKMAKFGLREEPARTVGWIRNQDKLACYTYAVSEMNRANRGWRTYNLTIPLRPELKLGFPMYLPHKDMYGYIKSISISYSTGGTATMSILLDTLRKRPLFPTQAPASGTAASAQIQNTMYTTQPSLVMQWTTPPNAQQPGNSNSQDTYNIFNQSEQDYPSPATMSEGTSTDTSAKLVNNPATQLQPKGKPVYTEEQEVITTRSSQLGTSWATKADTSVNCFRVQNDKITQADTTITSAPTQTPTPLAPPESPFLPPQSGGVDTGAAGNTATSQAAGASNSSVIQTAQTVVVSPSVTVSSGLTAGEPFFSAKNWGPGTSGVNATYMKKILSSQPYTDEGGYELVSPFPWGRWRSLKRALAETRMGIVVLDNATSNSTVTVGATNPSDVFLFAGVGTPSDFTPASALAKSIGANAAGTAGDGGQTSDAGQTSLLQSQIAQLTNISTLSASYTSFELVTPAPGAQQTAPNMNSQPENLLIYDLSSAIVSATNAFLIGRLDPSQSTSDALKGTIQNNSNAVGVTPPANPSLSQSQTFVSKLLNGNQSTSQ